MTVGAGTKMNKMKDKLYLSISKYNQLYDNIKCICRESSHYINHHNIHIKYSMQKKYLVQLVIWQYMQQFSCGNQVKATDCHRCECSSIRKPSQALIQTSSSTSLMHKVTLITEKELLLKIKEKTVWWSYSIDRYF